MAICQNKHCVWLIWSFSGSFFKHFICQGRVLHVKEMKAVRLVFIQLNWTVQLIDRLTNRFSEFLSKFYSVVRVFHWSPSRTFSVTSRCGHLLVEDLFSKELDDALKRINVTLTLFKSRKNRKSSTLRQIRWGLTSGMCSQSPILRGPWLLGVFEMPLH